MEIERKLMPIELRILGSENESLLWKYLYFALFVPLGSPPPPREIIKDPSVSRYVANWGRQRGDFGLLAVGSRGNYDIGAVWLRLWPNDERGYGFVDTQTPELSIAVRPEHRGKGVGTLLLKELLAEASVRYPAVSLSVSNTNPAIRLYERHGFEPLATSNGASTMLRRGFR